MRAYTIFIAENLQAFILAVTDCKTYIATRYLIFAQLIIFLPLAMIRNLAKLSGTALVADAFILIGRESCRLCLTRGQVHLSYLHCRERDDCSRETWHCRCNVVQP